MCALGAKKRGRGQRVSERLFDLTLASVGLLATAPVILGVAAAIRWRMGRPVLFRQARPGLHGEIFTIYKFRTMRSAPAGTDVDDALRITPLGQFLRKTSLDELPELFNVLEGSMSLVGPRPLLPEYLDRYTPEQARRHLVKPGITGWTAVNGRNALSWKEKFELDCWYVDNKSIWLDVRILLATVVIALRRQGVAHPGQATMPVFMGTQAEQPGESGDDADSEAAIDGAVEPA